MDKYKDYSEFIDKRLTDPNQRGYSGDSLLDLVARVGTLEEVDLLVAANAQIDSPGDMGYTPLHSAASQARLDMVEHLLKLGADPTVRSEFGTTAAETAEILDHPEIATFIRNFNK